jgi:HAE1 family hydrophobic/amphiphilic exporter-1
VKFDMFPAGQTRQLNLNYDLNGAYRLEDLEKNIGKIERWLTDHKEEFEIRSVYSFMSENFGAGTFILLHEDERAKRPASEIMEDIRKGLPKIAIGEANFGQQRRGGANGGLQLTLVGDSGATLRELAKTLVPVISHVEGLRDVRVDEGSSNREVSVRVDRERAAQYGFSAQEVASFIGIALRGAPLREFRGGDHEVPVWLRFQGSDTASVDSLNDYKLRKANGELIPLMALVDVKTSDIPTGIQRQNRQTALAIKINLAENVPAPKAREAIEAALKPVTMPPGYRYSFDGGFNDSDEAGGQMLINTVLALVMIYVVMAALFESLVFPVAILTSIVFSIFGVFWLFWLTGTTFSIMASIGILILMGVVVNNGIVMVEHINQLRHDGLSRTEALVRGARDRLRPIIMTMGCTILGMFPLCIGSTQIGGDGPPYYPMARAIVGGLIFSTIITLLVLPSIYAILDDWRLAAAKAVRQARSKMDPDYAPEVA